ncbi:unnamed protein product [Symbiodinium sp. CCMP2592]|nr:unnamed protein product [Symbiodinium sp. CCMP2592]
MRSLAYGSETLTPPTSQRILDEVLARVEPPVSAFAESLEGSNGNAVAAASLNMIEALNQLQSLYIEEATTAFPSLPAARVDAASRQILLAQKGARESIQFVYGITGSNAAVFDTMGQWQALQDNLKNGGNGLPAISPQRPDLSQQWQEVQVYWDRLKAQFRLGGPGRLLLGCLVVSKSTLRAFMLIGSRDWEALCRPSSGDGLQSSQHACPKPRRPRSLISQL